MKYCIHCGNEIRANDNFCQKCGVRICPPKTFAYDAESVSKVKSRLKAQQIIFFIYSIVMLVVFLPLTLWLFYDANGAFSDAVELIAYSENFLYVFLGLIIILMYICAPMGVVFGVGNLILAINTSKVLSSNNPEKIIKWGASVLKLILCIAFNLIALPFVISCFTYTKRNCIKRNKA